MSQPIENVYNIWVSPPNGEPYSLDIPIEKTILDVKNVLRNEHDVQMEICQMKIVYKGKQLEDREIIGDVRPCLNGQTIHLVDRRAVQPAGGPRTGTVLPPSSATQPNASTRPAQNPVQPNEAKSSVKKSTKRRNLNRWTPAQDPYVPVIFDQDLVENWPITTRPHEAFYKLFQANAALSDKLSQMDNLESYTRFKATDMDVSEPQDAQLSIEEQDSIENLNNPNLAMALYNENLATNLARVSQKLRIHVDFLRRKNRKVLECCFRAPDNYYRNYYQHLPGLLRSLSDVADIASEFDIDFSGELASLRYQKQKNKEDLEEKSSSNRSAPQGGQNHGQNTATPNAPENPTEAPTTSSTNQLMNFFNASMNLLSGLPANSTNSADMTEISNLFSNLMNEFNDANPAAVPATHQASNDRTATRAAARTSAENDSAQTDPQRTPQNELVARVKSIIDIMRGIMASQGTASSDASGSPADLINHLSELSNLLADPNSTLYDLFSLIPETEGSEEQEEEGFIEEILDSMSGNIKLIDILYYFASWYKSENNQEVSDKFLKPALGKARKRVRFLAQEYNELEDPMFEEPMLPFEKKLKEFDFKDRRVYDILEKILNEGEAGTDPGSGTDTADTEDNAELNSKVEDLLSTLVQSSSKIISGSSKIQARNNVDVEASLRKWLKYLVAGLLRYFMDTTISSKECQNLTFNFLSKSSTMFIRLTDYVFKNGRQTMIEDVIMGNMDKNDVLYKILMPNSDDSNNVDPMIQILRNTLGQTIGVEKFIKDVLEKINKQSLEQWEWVRFVCKVNEEVSAEEDISGEPQLENSRN